MFELMLKPAVECLILVGIHAYLGLHVIRRRVIFVDLALAQIAALGTIVGGILGLMDGTSSAMLYSLTFCMVGAALFAFTRVRHDRIPHEAIIGLVYIIAFSTAVLIVQKTEGVEHMEGILVGNLMFVRWSDIIATGVTYLFVGAFHLIYWKKFLLISEYPEKAFRQGINVRLWDFLFYASFGFVITFSTRVAGVLLVFVFLVAPAIMALLISNRFGRQLAVGWGSGTLVTVFGLFLSVEMDLSPGPTVVAFYGLILAVMAVVVYVVRSQSRPRALVKSLIGTGLVTLLGLGIYLEGTLLASLGDGEPVLHHHGHVHTPSIVSNQRQPAPQPAPETSTLEKATRGCVGPGKIKRYAAFSDELARLDFIGQKLKEDKRKGLGFLLIFLSDPESTEFYRSEGVALLTRHFQSDFGYRPELGPDENADALSGICNQLNLLKRTADPASKKRIGRGR